MPGVSSPCSVPAQLLWGLLGPWRRPGKGWERHKPRDFGVPSQRGHREAGKPTNACVMVAVSMHTSATQRGKQLPRETPPAQKITSKSPAQHRSLGSGLQGGSSRVSSSCPLPESVCPPTATCPGPGEVPRLSAVSEEAAALSHLECHLFPCQ